jgi:hypothetical protein
MIFIHPVSICPAPFFIVLSCAAKLFINVTDPKDDFVLETEYSRKLLSPLASQ